MNTTKSKVPPARERIERNIVRDRKTGHYLVTLYSGYDEKGAIRSSKTYHTLAEAREAKKKHESEMFLGKKTCNTQITVSQCIEQYIAEKNLAETTRDNYNTRLKRIVKHPLGKRKLVNVQKIDIVRYMDAIEREGELSNRSINGDRRLLQTIFNYAMDCGYVSQNVVNTVPKKQE